MFCPYGIFPFSLCFFFCPPFDLFQHSSVSSLIFWTLCLHEVSVLPYIHVVQYHTSFSFGVLYFKDNVNTLNLFYMIKGYSNEQMFKLFDWTLIHVMHHAGDSWSHSCTNRVILYWNGNERHAYIDKSPSLKSASAPFSVTSKGIRNATSHCKRVRMM